MALKISDQGTAFCRVCNSKNLVSTLDLGCHPLPAEYGLKADSVMDRFPLHLRICADCGLGQIGEYVFPDRIFHDNYPYLSSSSSYWLDHASRFCNLAIENLHLKHDSLVLEIASNDGYLLSNFQSRGIQVLGVEPASNVARIANKQGVNTICEFFGVETAKKLLTEGVQPDLIVANNVFAHVPNMHDFMEGIALLAGSKTMVSIENPSFATLLDNAYFDTIYHEHYSYLSAHSVQRIASMHGLNLVRVDSLPTHGGSNRYWLSKISDTESSVSQALQDELDRGLFDPSKWSSFQEKSQNVIDGLRDWLLARSGPDYKIAAYGAAHKGNTFLNAVGDSSSIIQYIVDASPAKHGKFLPGSQIPVFPPTHLRESPPSDVLILPWNIADEISTCITSYVPNANKWIAQPNMKRL